MNILTLKKGNKYNSSIVNNLYLSIKKNSSIEFNFFCYTDDTDGLLESIIPVIINNPEEFPVHWHKIEFHKAGFAGIKPNEDVIIMDIDMIILQNIDDILTFPVKENEFGAIFRWWSMRTNWCPINGGFQKFKHGSTDFIWRKFIEKPNYWPTYYSSIGEAAPPYMGEQNFIHHNIENCGLERKYLPLDWFAKYNPLQPELFDFWKEKIRDTDYFKNGKFDPSIKVVHFSNGKGKHNSMELHNDKWLKKYWYV
tara:strand:- start:14272 stop:15030 length:759 start_codon:yes stop_codon:yes gene_type:complete